nr:peptidase, M15A family [uncultured bacterium]
MQLSPHFTLAELSHSNTATRLDIDNTPLAEEIANLEILAEGLEQVRTKLDSRPILISSGFRCLELNRALKSKDTSYHTVGLAADFTSTYGNVQEVMRAIADSSIQFDQLILEFGKWIHIAFPKQGEKPRRQMMRIGKSGVLLYE